MTSLSEMDFAVQGGQSNETDPSAAKVVNWIYPSGEQYGYTIHLYYSFATSATPISQPPGSTTPRN